MACILQPLPFSNFEILTEGSEVSTGSGNWKALVLRPSIRIPIKAIQDFKLQPGGKFSVSPSSTKGLFYKGQYRGKKKSICILEIIATAGLWKGKRVTASQKPPKDINPWCEWHKKKEAIWNVQAVSYRHAEVKSFFCIGLGLGWEQRSCILQSCSERMGCRRNLTFLWENKFKSSIHMQLQFKSTVLIHLLYKNDSVNLIESKKPKGGRRAG